MRTQYGRLIDDAVTRWDVNFVIGELIGELNSSHTYRGGGDEEDSAHRGIGMLGVDWELANGAYRIKRIVRGGPWDADVRSPLLEPGVSVSEGDYVLAVNGMPLDVSRDPWAGFDGLANKPAWLTVNSRPTTGGLAPGAGASASTTKWSCGSAPGSRSGADASTRRRAARRATSTCRAPARTRRTSSSGSSSPSAPRTALVIDERFNSGGQIPDRFIELLNRPILSYWGVRDGASQQWPPVAHRGPKVMLINGWSGSGGDAFPFYFREAQLGPLIGTRTWGGLIGISGIARPGRWRRRHGADLPHVRSEGPVVRRRPRRRSGHPRGRRSWRAGQGDRCPTRTRDRRSDVSAEVNDPGAVEASLRASRAVVAVGSAARRTPKGHRMDRRQFIERAAAAAAVLPITSAAGEAGQSAARSFKLKYAPHIGMFEQSAGKDPLDQIRFMADNGFRAFEDNGMMTRTPDLQQQMGDLLAKRGMTMGVFVIDGGDNWKVSLATGKPEFKEVFLKACRDAAWTSRSAADAKWMTVVPGYFARELPMGIQTGHVIDAMRAAPTSSRRTISTMVLEPLSDNPDLFLRTSDQAYARCRAVNSPACKILCDMYHIQRNQGRMIDAHRLGVGRDRLLPDRRRAGPQGAGHRRSELQ